MSRPSRYGSDPHDRTTIYARALFASIERDLPEVEAFTREDLLHLPALSHVSSITRYRYVCEAVARLIEAGKIIARGRSYLVLAGKVRAYDKAFGGLPLGDRYLEAVMRVVDRLPPSAAFSVMDVVNEWRSDPHLTINTKRIAVRDVLRRAVREDRLEQQAHGLLYVRPRGS